MAHVGGTDQAPAVHASLNQNGYNIYVKPGTEVKEILISNECYVIQYRGTLNNLK